MTSFDDVVSADFTGRPRIPKEEVEAPKKTRRGKRGGRAFKMVESQPSEAFGYLRQREHYQKKAQ